LLETSDQIAKKIRKYMLIRTLASAVTGLAVFVFTLSIGLELAVAWGIISFVLNYIPYIGPLVAVVLPVIFATAQFESWQMAAIVFGVLYLIQFVIGNYLEPLLTGTALTIRDAVCIFFLGFSMGHARGIYWHPSDNRTFHHLGTESIHALDSEPHVNF